jgi:hypothetical protein
MPEHTLAIKAQRNGFECVLTLSSSDAQKLMDQAIGVLDWLVGHGFTPLAAPAPAAPPWSAPPATPAAEAERPKPVPTLPDGTPDPAWCPIHGVAMQRREREGQVWYSHKLADGTYCKGKPKDTPR